MDLGGENKPEFSKVLMPGFEQKLRIPPAFDNNIWSVGSFTDRSCATIHSSLEKAWRVELHREEDGSIFFENGWPEVVQAHQLQYGYFLVFRYEGDMAFTMKVFDLSGCIKQYTPIADKGHKKGKEITRPRWTRSMSRKLYEM